MKKILFVFLCVTTVWAQIPTTPKLKLQIPVHGTPNWDKNMNFNFSLLDSYLSGGTPLPFNLSLAGNLNVGGSVTLSAIHGSTQCAHFDSNGLLTGTGKDCQLFGIQSGGTTLPLEPLLNFIAGTNQTISCVDDPSNQRTNCTFSASGGGGGGGDVFQNPAGAQLINQPIVGGLTSLFDATLLGQRRQGFLYDWSQTVNVPITVGVNTITLGVNTTVLTGNAGCPKGISGTANGVLNANTWIYIQSAGGDAQQPGEPVLITYPSASGVACVPGAASGTITFTSAYAHASGAVLKSGSQGFKEAVNDSATVRPVGQFPQMAWVDLSDYPQNILTVNAPVFISTSNIRVVGSVLVDCNVNMSCVSMGDTVSTGLTPAGGVKQYYANGNGNNNINQVLDGLGFRATTTYSQNTFNLVPTAGLPITQGQTGLVTLTFSTCPAAFWPLVPDQILWLAGTSGGLNSSVYAVEGPGPGDFVQVTGGTCTPGASNGTIIIEQATPNLVAFNAHDVGSSLSNGVSPAIEDNAQQSVIANITPQNTPSPGIVFHSFGFGVQIDNDQSAVVDNLKGEGWRCDPDFCGSATFNPGPSGINAGIMHLVNGTMGNCTEWYGGNEVELAHTVCQAFANFAALFSVKRGGAVSKATMTSVHRERGNVTNSLGTNLGGADVINQGYQLVVDGNRQGMTAFPTFDVAGTPGGQLQVYYLSIMDTTAGTKSPPIPIGQAQSPNPNTNNVTVKWVTADVVAGHTVKFELYRLAPAGFTALSTYLVAPYAGLCDGAGSDGTCLVATSIDPSTICDIHGVCIFTDNVASTTAATPYTGSDGSTTAGFFPNVSFSPGGIVLSGSATYQGTAGVCVINVGSPWSAAAANAFNNFQPVSSCLASGGANNMQLSALPYSSTSNTQMGILLPEKTKTSDAAQFRGVKGRINFIGGGTYPRDIATWRDSQPEKTYATSGSFGSGAFGTLYALPHRPIWDAADVATGIEVGGNELYQRATTGFCWYIQALPDNSTSCLFPALHLTATQFLLSSGDFTVTGGNINLLAGSCNGCGPFSRSGTQISDNFNRADGGLGANWTTQQGTWAIQSNRVTFTATGAGTYAHASYTGSSFANDQYSQATVIATGTSGIGVTVRSSSSVQTNYALYCLSGVSSNLFKVVAGVGANLASGAACSIGDVIRLEVKGSTLTGTRYPVGGGAPVVLTATDSAITSGSPGLYGSGTVSSGFLDNFFAGDLAWSTTASLSVPNLKVNGATWTSTAGVPSANCAVGDIDTNTSAASASTVLYVCAPANTWTAVTVP